MIDEGLALDLQTHQYSYDGVRVGGVSEILTALGIVDRRYFKEYALARGTAVHTACEYLLNKRLDWKTLDERIKPYVEAAAKFLADAGADLEDNPLIERPVWHPALRYAGMPDLVCKVFGVRAVIDWKSGGTGAAGLATAAYELAVRTNEKLTKPLRRMVVQLKPDGTYKKTDLTDANDYPMWTAAASLFNRFHINRKDWNNGERNDVA